MLNAADRRYLQALLENAGLMKAEAATALA